MRRTLWGLTGLGLLLGLVHLGLSAMAWRTWNPDLLWFAGSGLAIVLAGLLNIVMMRVRVTDPLQRSTWVTANLLMALFFGLAWSVLPQPQMMLGGGVFVLTGLAAAVARPSRQG